MVDAATHGHRHGTWLQAIVLLVVAVDEPHLDATRADGPFDLVEEATTFGMIGPVPEVTDRQDRVGALRGNGRPDDRRPR